MHTSKPDNPKRGSLRRWTAGLAICFLLLMFYGLWLFFNPYDKVQIEFSGLPMDTAFVCLVGDGPDGLVPMHWAISKVFPSSISPDACVEYAPPEGATFSRAVRWVDGGRVGVLRRTKDDAWFVAWFDGSKAELTGRSLLFGQGTWACNWTMSDRVEPWSESDLKKAGFN